MLWLTYFLQTWHVFFSELHWEKSVRAQSLILYMTHALLRILPLLCPCTDFFIKYLFYCLLFTFLFPLVFLLCYGQVFRSFDICWILSKPSVQLQSTTWLNMRDCNLECMDDLKSDLLLKLYSTFAEDFSTEHDLVRIRVTAKRHQHHHHHHHRHCQFIRLG